LQARYQGGQRFCEHCQQPVERTAVAGSLLFLFGQFTVPLGKDVCHITQPTFEVRHLPGRIVAFLNPGFNAPQHTLDVSAIYLDIATCPLKKFERCLAYLASSPPDGGMASIQVWYQGDLDRFDPNLKNALCNNFPRMTRLSEGREA
jgi:hypothetical protein